jgi:hypothetical protein
MPFRSLVAVLAALLAAPALAVTNTGQDASALSFVACNGRVGFRTAEVQQDRTDLTLDGDPADFSFQILDLSSGIVTNVGIDASGVLGCGGDLFGFGVSEANQGQTDLDGDSDKSDSVLHVYDAALLTTTNVGLPVSGVAVSSVLVAFTVPEASLGTDLNGDTDEDDQVVHVFDPVTTLTTNVGRAVADPKDLKVSGTLVAFRTSESGQNNTDLNGDLDMADAVLEVYDASGPTLTNTGRQAEPGIQMDGGVVAFLVNEAAHSAASLNGDTDVGDKVLHLWCDAAASCANPGIVNVAVDAGGGFVLSGDLVALRTRERNQFVTTFNPPDTDFVDVVAQVYRISTNTLTSTNLASEGRLGIAGNVVGIPVGERAQNDTDLNADGDRKDVVIHLYDASTAITTNTARAVQRKTCPHEAGTRSPRGACFAMGGDVLIFGVSERDQAKADLNGDSDARDAVVAVRRISTGVTTSTGIAMNRKSTLLAGSAMGAFLASERDQNQILNGDLDAADNVMAAFDLASGTPTILAQQAQVFFLVHDEAVVFRTTERLQTTDLNTDGDLGDNVLQFEGF